MVQGDVLPGTAESAISGRRMTVQRTKVGVIGSELHLAYLGQKTPEQALADAETAADAVLQSGG